jgi:hypothetical protein
VIIYKFTQGNLDAKQIASSRFQSPVKKKNRKLRYWRPTARSLVLQYTVPTNEYRNQTNVAEKNILILVEEKKNNLIQSFCHIT